jgi:hypothetical protein
MRWLVHFAGWQVNIGFPISNQLPDKGRWEGDIAFQVMCYSPAKPHTAGKTEAKKAVKLLPAGSTCPQGLDRLLRGAGHASVKAVKAFQTTGAWLLCQLFEAGCVTHVKARFF